MGKTSWQSKEKYNTAHYKQINLRVQKEIGEAFAQLVKSQGLSVNKVLSDYMYEYLRFYKFSQERPQ